MSFSCLQVWRRLHDSCTNSRVQPWPQACPGVLWTRLSRKCPKRETPKHATVPASLLLVVSGQDIQHPLPEQKATPHRRLLCLSDNTWPSKLSVQSTKSCRVRMAGPSSPLWARKFSLCFDSSRYYFLFSMSTCRKMMLSTHVVIVTVVSVVIITTICGLSTTSQAFCQVLSSF